MTVCRVGGGGGGGGGSGCGTGTGTGTGSGGRMKWSSSGFTSTTTVPSRMHFPVLVPNRSDRVVKRSSLVTTTTIAITAAVTFEIHVGVRARWRGGHVKVCSKCFG